jgi:hypothetical protein
LKDINLDKMEAADVLKTTNALTTLRRKGAKGRQDSEMVNAVEL